MTKARPKELNTYLEAADKTRCEGGEGRFHSGRYPLGQAERAGVSVGEYTVFVGFKNLYEHFPEWLDKHTNTLSHGRLFSPIHVGNKKPSDCLEGNLPAEPLIRNRNVRGYLANYLWANRGQHQSFTYEINDNKEVPGIIAHDSKATIVMIRHSWLLLLANRKDSFGSILLAAQKFQSLEQSFLDEMEKYAGTSNLRIMELDVAVQNTAEMLLEATEHMVSPNWKRLQVMPRMHNLERLDSLVRKLRNKGLKIRYEQNHQSKNHMKLEKNEYSKPYAVK